MPNSRTQGNPFKLKSLQLGAHLSPDFVGPSKPLKWWKMAGNGGEFRILGPSFARSPQPPRTLLNPQNGGK